MKHFVELTLIDSSKVTILGDYIIAVEQSVDHTKVHVDRLGMFEVMEDYETVINRLSEAISYDDLDGDSN